MTDIGYRYSLFWGRAIVYREKYLWYVILERGITLEGRLITELHYEEDELHLCDIKRIKIDSI